MHRSLTIMIACAGLQAPLHAGAAAADTQPPGLAAASQPCDDGAAAPVEPSAGVRTLADVPYLGPDRNERLDLYLPGQSRFGASRPAVVYIHGGGWMKGDKAAPREQSICSDLARCGYVAASINYRLGRGAWPDDLLDCKNAVRFLRAHAADYGIDPHRIAVMGTSAGGHLALMVGYTAGHALEPRTPYPGVSDDVMAVVDLYGPVDPSTRQGTDQTGAPNGKHYSSTTAIVLDTPHWEDPSLWKQFSPLTWIRKDSPPTLIVHGLNDTTVARTESIRLADALRATGVPHRIILLEGVGHSFDLQKWEGAPLPEDLRPVVCHFLDAQMRRTADAQ